FIASSSSEDVTVKLWEAGSNKLLSSFQIKTQADNAANAPPKAIEALSFSPDSGWLAVGSYWDANLYKMGTAITSQGQPDKITGLVSSVFSLAFSPDNKTVAAGAINDISLSQFNSGGFYINSDLKLKGHTNSIFSLAFSP